MNREKGLTLVELLVVMLSLMVVMAMGFDILLSNGNSVARGLSQGSKADRLRFLQRRLDLDLESRYSTQTVADSILNSATSSGSGETLLRTEIVDQQSEAEVKLLEILYRLEEDPPGSGLKRLVRIADPDLSTGLGPEASVNPLFHLTLTESFGWRQVTGPGADQNSLRFSIQDSRFGGWTVERESLLPGGTP